MSVRWLIAKYIPDLRRGEPINVGVILLAGDRVLTRFIAQSDDKIDGRSLRGAGIRTVDTYRAWVQYWRGVIDEHGIEAESILTKEHAGSSYFVAAGGERILGGDVETPEELVDSLFAMLVEREEVPVESANLAQLTEKVLKELTIFDAATPDFEVQVHGRDNRTYPVRFDFRFDNGAANLIRRVYLSAADKRSWSACQSAAWAFEKVNRETIDGLTPRCIAMVRRRHDEEQDQQIEMLGESGIVIDLNDIATAVEQLRVMFHIGTVGNA